MAKPFLSYEQQIDKLRHDKQLLIFDTEYAKRILSELSYYSLIGGYKDLFKNPVSGKYSYGVTFEEIVAFYYFDEELRSLFLKYILHVERHMKSMLSYYFSEKYGEQQSAYLDEQNYNLNEKNKQEIQRLVKSLQKSVSMPTQYTYIAHHIKTYKNVPLWVAMNALTFGQVSKMYQYATSDVRTKISKNFVGITEKQLHQFVTVAACCRNICAHGERLYSFKIKEAIPDTIIHQKMSIPQKHGQYICGKSDLFAVVIALKYLIADEEFKRFKKHFGKLIKNVLKKCPHISRENLLNVMGIPDNWEKITRYKTYREDGDSFSPSARL
ncbi:MAG: Abi family protein [Eubacteriales bacterium]|nr:Abi family protein [Eubacteriales bacterium]